MSPHPLDHNLPSASIYKRRGEVVPNGKKPVKEFIRNIGRGIDKIGKKLFGKQNREQEDLRNGYQRDKASVCSQCHQQTNALRQEMTNSAPAAYAQTAPVQSPSAPSAQYPSTTAAPSTSPSPSPTPSTEAVPTTPVTPTEGSQGTDYVAGQDNGNQGDREKKYPESQYPPNLWKGPHGVWVSGMPGKDRPGSLEQQYQSLATSGVKKVFTILDGTNPEYHPDQQQAAASKAGVTLIKVSILDTGPIEAAINAGEPCLVHCLGGQHRGPTTAAAAYLKTGKSTNIDEAFAMAGGRLDENFFSGYTGGQSELAKLVVEAKKKGINVEDSEIVKRLRSAGQRV